MPNYVLDSSATQVNTAINNVVNAQTTPSNGSSLMVTSDGIYQALNNIQHSNFNTGTLVTSTDTIASNSSDTQIPTTQAVKSYVDAQGNMSAGFTELGTTSATGTAASDGFIIARATGDNSTDSVTMVTVASIEFNNTTQDFGTGGSSSTCVPIASGESYSATASGGNPKIYFKALS